MGEAAEVLNTDHKKSNLNILAIPSLRLIFEYIKQYKKVSEKNL
jgi:hypothetical protein